MVSQAAVRCLVVAAATLPFATGPATHGRESAAHDAAMASDGTRSVASNPACVRWRWRGPRC
eukprot:7990360-Alexandrium_andersonii.AAC.1